MEFTTKEAFLLDALEYYTTDTNRRCKNTLIPAPSYQMCYYSPLKAGKEGISEGCLIGRHLTSENQQIADSDPEDLGITNIMTRYPEIFPSWMKSFGMDFLSDCQSLHDREANWDESGLTVTGKAHLSNILNIRYMDKSQFQKYLM